MSESFFNRSNKLRCIISLGLFFLLTSPKAMAQYVDLNIEIKGATESAKQNADLTEEQRKQVLAELNDASILLTKAQEQINLANTYEKLAASASQKVITIERNIQQLRDKSVNIDTRRPFIELENQLLLEESQQTREFANLTQKQAEQTNLSLRANEIAQQLSSLRIDKTEITDDLNQQAVNGLSLLAISKDLKKRANVAKLSETIKTLEREVATIPARQSLVNAELIELRVKNEFQEKRISALRSFLAASRTSKVEKIVQQNKQTLGALLQHPKLTSIAQENLALAEQLERLQANSYKSEESTDKLQGQLLEVQQSSETVERVLATGRVTDELGELLRRLRASIPREAAIELRKSDIEEDAVRHQLNVILWQERLRGLANIAAAAQNLLFEQSTEKASKTTMQQKDANDYFSPFQLEEAQALTIARRNLLQELIELSNYQSDRIIEEKLIINQLLSASIGLRELLERRLIWLPSNSGKAGNLGVNLRDSMDWLFSPKAWWDLLQDFYKGALAVSVLPLTLFAFAMLIVLGRSKIKRTLWSLVDGVGKVQKDTYQTTPLALLLTLVLALPLPLCLFAVATTIYKGAAPLSFANAIATGLSSVSSISLVLLFFRSMSRKDGLFEKHFGWSDVSRIKLRSMLTWFVWLQSLAAFLFASAIASGLTELRYGLAILAFIIGSIGIAVFSYQFFQPKNGVATSIVGETPVSVLTILAFPIVVAAPLFIGLLPLFGFFDTAVELQSRLFSSGILLVFASVAYGIMLRIFLVAFRRYIVKKERLDAAEAEALALQNQELSESGVESTASEPPAEGIDEQEVMRQGRSIMLWITALFFIAGLWFIWKSLLPALGIVDDIVLWQEIKMVDGVELSSGVTLWDIILSLGFVIGGFVAAKNIRGVMEIGFFERFEMDAGARYATITILGYVLVGAGIVIGFSQLGIDWSKLQWIIAALGVGLGFGLQEIVANFVSGLIILFERPIRVGDFVTIGNLSGTVSNIKIRATTVTDFDNREVLLPNKSIITENVTNWTLKDSVTRIVVKIGVAYGSDIDKVKGLLMQVAEGLDEVLKQPAPQVFFLEHGDSSLNFEIRVFVVRPEDRLPLTHAINTGVNKALAENNISIPFPQRDLHIVSGHLGNTTV
ncbi:mechanosensitive ion channel domain-containing protein [Brumicola nitratireducens]|uniref:Mechanosensitive ion channel protein MscS n=1 Tax=Glaciecola nitratireducens (strain JCM 12485 / KCTC 12276 / FR1064) TaxID=1085623 RepID=G4QGI5_GLANF|nr:mechanosensitive ion channel domain-containing protein [Glaciecola nitratireducens]AEP29622.1 mechanosensitive ion channel protein MscS [Glaciecola nitratireducens FR1064]